jgi:hypothetical protein
MKQTVQKITPHFDTDFRLIGIASHENDYRLAWGINTQLNLSLVRVENALVYHDKYKQEISLSTFVQEFPEQGFTIKLFSNRGEDFFLLEDLKNIDFFIKIEGEINQVKYQEMISLLKSVDIIMGVFHLPIDQVKKINRIIF